MGKIIIFLFAFLFIAGFIFGLVFDNFILTGRVTEDISKNYTYTRAICSNKNQCIDILVTCENGRVKSLEPVSNLVKHDQNWKDPRQKLEEFCS